MRRITTTLAITGMFIVSAHGQGFENLNFESAQSLPGNPGYYGTPVAVTNALPAWIAYNGNSELSAIYYVSNSFPGDSTSVELESGSLAIGGNNLTVGLYLGGSISQTGFIPADTESVQFEAHISANGLAVTLGGQSLSYSVLSEGSGYDVYGANIPAGLDGQAEELVFVAQGLTPGVLLDNIEFSTSGVPEPGELAILGLGALLYAFWRWRRRERLG